MRRRGRGPIVLESGLKRTGGPFVFSGVILDQAGTRPPN
jgi:hypothetical protein